MVAHQRREMGGKHGSASCGSNTAISRAETSQTPRMCLEGDHANFWTHFKVPGLQGAARTQLEERAHTGRHTQLAAPKAAPARGDAGSS